MEKDAEFFLAENIRLEERVKELEKVLEGSIPAPKSLQEAILLHLCSFSSKTEDELKQIGSIPVFITAEETSSQYVIKTYVPVDSSDSKLHNILSLRNIVNNVRGHEVFKEENDPSFNIQVYQASFDKKDYSIDYCHTVVRGILSSIRNLQPHVNSAFGVGLRPIIDEEPWSRIKTNTFRPVQKMKRAQVVSFLDLVKEDLASHGCSTLEDVYSRIKDKTPINLSLVSLRKYVNTYLLDKSVEIVNKEKPSIMCANIYRLIKKD